jgi:hypothetical protein
MIYSQSLNGTGVELIAPSPAQVDFREIAETLAHLNRYAGAASPPVSVGLHTLIVIDVAPGFAKPYAALHDAHEARIGDIISPTVRALREIAAVEHGVRVADALEDAIEELSAATTARSGRPPASRRPPTRSRAPLPPLTASP